MIKFGDNYEISEMGEIYALSSTYSIPSRIQKSKGGKYINIPAQIRFRKRCKLTPTLDGYGYYQIRYYLNGKRTCKKLHILVAEAYIPNPENKRTVNHKDGDKSNNVVSNLEWATDSENSNHAYSTGLKQCMGWKVDGIYFNTLNEVIKAYPTMKKYSVYNKLRGIESGMYLDHYIEKINKSKKDCN